MRENVGGLDQAARAIGGAALLVLGVDRMRRGEGPLGGAAVVLGAVLAITAATRRCPLNEALGIDTARRVRLPVAVR